MEKPVWIHNQDLRLEARLFEGDIGRAAVLTHPHPLYGGDMDNAVVTALADVLRRRNWSTLRFNFRGTGRSEGRFEDGRGEVSDLEAAVGLLEERGLSVDVVAGYSFGAWIAAHWAAAAGKPIKGLVLVSPPAALLGFDGIALPGPPALIVSGDEDPWAPAETVRALAAAWNAHDRLKLIPGCDHFFTGRFQQLTEAVAAAVDAL